MFGFLGRSQRSSHRFCQENLSAFIDGQLPTRDRERVRQHLEQCEDCRWHLRTMESTIRGVRSLPRLKAPRSFHIPHSVPAPSLPIWMRPWVYGALQMATAAVAVALVVAVVGNTLAVPPTQGLAPVQTVLRASSPRVEATAPAEALAAPRQAPEGTPAPPPAAKGALTYQGTPTARGKQPPTAAPAAATSAAALPNDTPASLPTQAPGGGTPSDREAAAQTAAPKGMGGEEMRSSAAVAAATAPALAAVPEPSGTSDAARRDAGALDTTAEPRAEAYEEHGAQLPMLQRFRRLIGGYPWDVWAIGAGVLLVPLLALTLWLRTLRARWP